MRLVDTHCHLNDRRAFPDPEPVIDEARAAGVEALVVVGIDTESSRLALEIAEAHDGVYAAVGWHPNSAEDFTEADLKAVEEMLDHPKVRALGEIGLDFYREHASREAQERCLLAQLELAESRGEAVVFHCRDAYPELLGLLEGRARLPYLFHCFAGTEGDAERCLALGGLFGVDGPVTYPKSDELRSMLRSLPQDRLVLETDAPWMPPAPHRGQRNQPAWLPLIGERLAEEREEAWAELAGATTRNAARFFGLEGLS
jgi:TatD DNase family protein